MCVRVFSSAPCMLATANYSRAELTAARQCWQRHCSYALRCLGKPAICNAQNVGGGDDGSGSSTVSLVKNKTGADNTYSSCCTTSSVPTSPFCGFTTATTRTTVFLIEFRDAEDTPLKRRFDALANFHSQAICSAIFPSSFSATPFHKSMSYTITAQTGAHETCHDRTRQHHENHANTTCQDLHSQRDTRYYCGRRIMPPRHLVETEWCNSKNTCDPSQSESAQ
jgi:hypothetical protein